MHLNHQKNIIVRLITRQQISVTRNIHLILKLAHVAVMKINIRVWNLWNMNMMKRLKIRIMMRKLKMRKWITAQNLIINELKNKFRRLRL